MRTLQKIVIMCLAAIFSLGFAVNAFAQQRTYASWRDISPSNYPAGTTWAVNSEGRWYAVLPNQSVLPSANNQVTHEVICFETETSELIRLINAERIRIGKPALSPDPVLMDFAKVRANEGGRVGGAPHTRPNGDFVWNESWSGHRVAERAFDGWMNSQGHREAMLSQRGNFGHSGNFGVAVGNGGAVIIFDTVRVGTPPLNNAIYMEYLRNNTQPERFEELMRHWSAR